MQPGALPAVEAPVKHPAAPTPRVPLWAWAAAGFFLASVPALRGARRTSALPGGTPAIATGLVSAGPRLPSARELRAIDGVGALRSRRLARAMWEDGPLVDPRWLETVEGIGPITAARIWEALGKERRGPRCVTGLPPRLPPPRRAP